MFCLRSQIRHHLRPEAEEPVGRGTGRRRGRGEAAARGRERGRERGRGDRAETQDTVLTDEEGQAGRAGAGGRQVGRQADDR
jgi:hypothetical protein